MRADHDRPQNLQYFPAEFYRLIRVGAPVRSAVDWPERELVICDDPGMQTAELQYALGKVSLRPAVIAALQFVVPQLGSGMS